MRYRLRTLLIILTLGPPILAAAWWAWPTVAKTNRQRPIADFDKLIELITSTVGPDTWDDVGGPGSIDEYGTSCFVLTSVEAEDDPVGPDPCGRSYSFRPFSAADDDGLVDTARPIDPRSIDDPFATPN